MSTRFGFGTYVGHSAKSITLVCLFILVQKQRESAYREKVKIYTHMQLGTKYSRFSIKYDWNTIKYGFFGAFDLANFDVNIANFVYGTLRTLYMAHVTCVMYMYKISYVR